MIDVDSFNVFPYLVFNNNFIIRKEAKIEIAKMNLNQLLKYFFSI